VSITCGEAEEPLLHAEDRGGPRHLLAADPGQVGLDLRTVHRGIEDVAALPAGERADQHLHALADIARHGGGALTRLVVRVCVHGHQPELASQQLSPSC